MTAPNIGGSGTITAKSIVVSPSNTSEAVVLTVPASQLWKVTSLYAVNIAASDSTITIYVRKAAAAAATSNMLIKAATIPTNCSLVIVDKESIVNLEETDILSVIVGTANTVNVVVSYEVFA